MKNAILAGVGLMATTALAGPGSAIVINSCSYAVHLSNVPSAGGGYNAIDQMLSPGGTYSQVYTSLSNGNGWSIKLSQTGDFGSNVMQYEYTYQNDGTIWYDLSEVNGNPWDGNWEFTATSGCTPRQAAYRYSTDEAYGMQSCADTASVTVTLCSGDAGGAPAPSGGSWGSTPSKVATPPSSAPQAPSVVPSAAPTHTWGPPGGFDLGNNRVVESPAASDAPAASSAWNGPAVTVTNVVYTTVNEIVTAEATPAHKRHVHHPRHPHHRA